MSFFYKILPILLCFILMTAHLSRANMIILMTICLIFPLILLWKNKISARAIQLVLVLFGFEWVRTLIVYARIRIEEGEDWLRLALILGVVAILNFTSILTYRSRSMMERYKLM